MNLPVLRGHECIYIIFVYTYVILLKKVYNILHQIIIFVRAKIAIILGKNKEIQYLIMTIPALNQLLVIVNLPAVNPDE